jgi:hypothetical protein
MRFEINDINKPEGCKLKIIYQKTTKPKMKKRFVPAGIKVVKLQCMDIPSTSSEDDIPCQMVREVIAGSKGDSVDEIVENALLTAALLRKVYNCKKLCAAAS